MKRSEQVISLFWMTLAGWVCFGAVRLKVGSFSDPGSGFLPFWVGALLGVLALAHFFNITLAKPQMKGYESPWANVKWRNGVYVIIALLLYTFLLPRLGYILDTFLLMLFLFSLLGRQKWWIVILGTLLIIGITYLVFKIWLLVQFPAGWWGLG
jgi:hypothetical protein